MLSIFKRKKNEANKVFGDVKLFGRKWQTSVKVNLVLWKKAHLLNCIVVADKNNPEITQSQETVYRKFEENLVTIQECVESIVSDYYGITDQTVLLSKFHPYELMISPKAECVIIANNADDEEMDDVLPGIAVAVYPKMAVFTEEDYSEYALFDGNDDVKVKLYGGE